MGDYGKEVPDSPRFREKVLAGEIVLTTCPYCGAEWAYVIKGSDVGCGHCFVEFDVDSV